MKLAVFSHVIHCQKGDKIYGYGPYVREMNMWFPFFDQVEIVAPLESRDVDHIDLSYQAKSLSFTKVPAISLTSFTQIARTIFKLPTLLLTIFKSMRGADHIHLRCPGNMGLLGCIVQILFPKKKKTAKYAGNWDPSADQPFSYRLQKWILNNTFLTRNMQVMAYGKWEGSSSNIQSFFTATYYESDKTDCEPRKLNSVIKFVFAGTLSEGKCPLYAVKLVEKLHRHGIKATLDFYGEGQERTAIEKYVADNGLHHVIHLHGNKPEQQLRQAYQQSHFLILPSKSEGWPKVVAESMFWASVPISTSISCVPFMIGNGSRGMLLNLSEDDDSQQILDLINDPEKYEAMAYEAMSWSRNYTMDFFELEIKRLIHG
ncbi:MAG: glycosyltransferase family 4 protein [Flavobacterium sp.]|nr:glycosyltransferase family 4 protein [Flavobacterium sp.]